MSLCNFSEERHFFTDYRLQRRRKTGKDLLSGGLKMENKDIIAVNSVGDSENQCVAGGDINARLYRLILKLI